MRAVMIRRLRPFEWLVWSGQQDLNLLQPLEIAHCRSDKVPRSLSPASYSSRIVLTTERSSSISGPPSPAARERRPENPAPPASGRRATGTTNVGETRELLDATPICGVASEIACVRIIWTRRSRELRADAIGLALARIRDLRRDRPPTIYLAISTLVPTF